MPKKSRETLRITEQTIFETSDGKQHSTLQLANHWVARDRVIQVLDAESFGGKEYDPDEILNTLGDKRTRQLVRDWLEHCDQIETEN